MTNYVLLLVKVIPLGQKWGSNIAISNRVRDVSLQSAFHFQQQRASLGMPNRFSYVIMIALTAGLFRLQLYPKVTFYKLNRALFFTYVYQHILNNILLRFTVGRIVNS